MNAGFHGSDRANQPVSASSERTEVTLCPLCGETHCSSIAASNDHRQYQYCPTCQLIFVDPQFHLSAKEETQRYAQHNNSIHQQGYVDFLNRVIMPALPYLNKIMIGLDYGCGPSPTLSLILQQNGITCFNYDPLFGFDYPHHPYDFIFATECFEHFYTPCKEVERICSLLKPGGYLGIMTEQWTSHEQFKSWYYKRDPTHVCFYHSTTFDYLCASFGFTIKYSDQSRVIVLQKNK